MTPYRGRRVLVLGAGGFIGRWVARALSRAGADLHLTARDPDAAGPILARWRVDATLHRLDCTHEAPVRALIGELGPEVLFNLVGYGVDRTERDEAFARRLNDELPGWLCRALTEAVPFRPRLVHVGSALEYGTIDGDLVEEARPKPTTLYGITKLAGTDRVERAVAAGTIDGVTARLFTVYGPGEHAGRLLPTLVEAARGDAPVELTEGRQRRDFTYVEEAAEGLLRLGAVVAPPPPVVNLATGVLTSVRGFVERAADVLGIAPERLLFGRVPTRGEEMEHAPVNLDRLRACLAWQPTLAPADGVLRAVRFLDTAAS